MSGEAEAGGWFTGDYNDVVCDAAIGTVVCMEAGFFMHAEVVVAPYMLQSSLGMFPTSPTQRPDVRGKKKRATVQCHLTNNEA